MRNQWLDGKIQNLQRFEIGMRLPVITPLPYLPLVKLLSEERNLQTDLLEINKRQKTCDAG